MSFTSFQNYLLKTYDDSNETNWFLGNTWGQFVNIEPVVTTQIKDAVLPSSNKNIITKEDPQPRVKSIPRIKSIKTLDLESNSVTKNLYSSNAKENMNYEEIETKAKYTYISVTGILFCAYLFINLQL
jgi:hypothetical protein